MGICPTCRRGFADGVEVCPEHGISLMPEQAFLSADTTLAAGQKVGDYVVDEVIAEGGFGTVYRVIHPLIGKNAAIKVLKREFSSNPEMVSRFIAEARAVNQIRHKNIIDIFAFGVLDDGRHYYVMELLEGLTLERHVKTCGRLPVTEALPIIRQLARALAAAHSAGITHRDLKPENVFLTFDEDGVATPKLLDFGIAKLKGQTASVHKTRSGAPMGTPLYMSPEQVYGREIDHRSDIYSLGILIYEVLTGAPPFDGDSVMDVLTAQTTAKAPSLRSAAPELPAELDGPVHHMLEKSPEKRPQSVTAALDKLMLAAELSGVIPTQSRRSGPQGMLPQYAVSNPGDVVRRESLASATTLAGELKRPASTPPDGRLKKSLLYGAGAVAVGGAVAVILAVRSPHATGAEGNKSAEPSAGASAVLVTPLLPSSAEPSAVGSALPASSVRVSFEGVPPDCEVLVGGKRVSSAKEGLVLAQGTERVKVTLRRPGYAPRDVWVVPDKDRTVSTDLVKAPPQPTTKPKASSGDLEF